MAAGHSHNSVFAAAVEQSGPHGPVFGHGGNARKVIFVCDATGSMLNKMPTLKQQLENAIHDLKPIQSFNVIFFYDGPKLLACDPEHMIMATPANQQKVQAFLDNVTPTGQTDPFPAPGTCLPTAAGAALSAQRRRPGR